MKKKPWEKKLFHEKKEIYKPRTRKNKKSGNNEFFGINRKEYDNLFDGKEYNGSGVSLTFEIMEKAVRDLIVFSEAEIFVEEKMTWKKWEKMFRIMFGSRGNEYCKSEIGYLYVCTNVKNPEFPVNFYLIDESKEIVYNDGDDIIYKFALAEEE